MWDYREGLNEGQFWANFEMNFHAAEDFLHRVVSCSKHVCCTEQIDCCSFQNKNVNSKVYRTTRS